VQDTIMIESLKMPYKQKSLLYGIEKRDGKMTEAEREFEAVKEFENAKTQE
jgi:hypothetical protein